jgi:hypothetical protein
LAVARILVAPGTGAETWLNLLFTSKDLSQSSKRIVFVSGICHRGSDMPSNALTADRNTSSST